MAHRAHSGGRSQALVPTTTPNRLLPQQLQSLGAENDAQASAIDDKGAARLAFLAAGTLLALASVAIAALNGWSRGASLPESLVWAGAGIALALVSLFGLSLMLTHHGQQRATAGIAWALGLTFTVVAALGSQHGGRELATRTEGAVVGNHVRHQADYGRAAAQLAELPATRPAAVIQQELAVLLQDRRLKSCSEWLDSARLRKTCATQVTPARIELANAQARETAQAAMATASVVLGSSGLARPANSDASAVRRYLEAIGIQAGVDRLADVLNLLTVLAVEFCGAAALALGRRPAVSVGHDAYHVNIGDGGLNAGVNATVNAPPGGAQAPVAPILNAPGDGKTAATIERLKRRILGDLERGPRSCSQRSLASEFGASVGYVNKALHELAAAGAVNVSTSRVGTIIVLSA